MRKWLGEHLILLLLLARVGQDSLKVFVGLVDDESY
jgi:hypothetical protein